ILPMINREPAKNWQHQPLLAASPKEAPNTIGGPSEEGPPLLSDSLTARASFTSGFPLYPYPNLPMTLRPVVNRCANSELRLDHLFTWSQWFGIKNPLQRKALSSA